MGISSQTRNGRDSSSHCFKLQMRIVLVHVLARVTGQLLADLERDVGVGHRRVKAVPERMERRHSIRSLAPDPTTRREFSRRSPTLSTPTAKSILKL